MCVRDVVAGLEVDRCLSESRRDGIVLEMSEVRTATYMDDRQTADLGYF